MDVQDLAQLRAVQDTSSVWYWEQDSEFRFVVDVRDKYHVPRPGERSIIGLRRWETPDCIPLYGTWEDHRLCLEAHLPFRDFEFQVGRGADLRYISTTGVPVYAAGRFAGYRGTAMNVTKLKRAQQASARARALSLLAGRLGKVVGWNFSTAPRQLEWSPGLGELLGMPFEFTPSRSRALRWLPKEERRRVIAAFGQCASGAGSFDIEMQVPAADGRTLWLRVVGELISQTGTSACQLQGAVQDISEGKDAQVRLASLGERLAVFNRELTARVEERTRELELVNTELKGFAHALAHDLKSPIAAVDGFTHALEDALASGRSERSIELAGRIRAASERMTEYVDALLSLAQTTQAQLDLTRVNLTAMCVEIVDELRARQPRRQVLCSIEEGMIATGDRRLMRVLLENLIGNAWKFTSRRERAVITIGQSIDESGSKVFGVQDNGAGFDMAFADRLFGSFQRLHGKNEFPGTGIGLANAQRIVIRHGGRIWARSREGEGATFCFTLGAGTTEV